ncbi:MAG: hypothetical protein IKT40_13010 [Bacilli bacterium]|nr:hypothetical protein [Bacilli bacterium]
MKFGIFSNNVLKIIACIAMLIDHMGLILFPKVLVLRFIGRIAFPIFAFLLAEGCFYTKNKLRHFLVLAGFAIIMQVVLFIATGMTAFSIFMHFSIAVGICHLIDLTDKCFRKKQIILAVGFILIILFLLVGVVYVDNATSYLRSNYGMYAVFIPVMMFLVRKYISKYHLFVNVFLICLSMVVMHYFYPYALYQLYGCFAAVIVLLYNGKKGKFNLKYLFYIFYPLHIVVLYGIAMILGG